MMRFLLVSILVLIASCQSAYHFSSAAKTSSDSCIEKLKPSFAADLYETQVDVVGKHLSGLLFFKTLGDTVHVVFMSKAGLTFFDFEFHDSGFTVHRILPTLNKKQVLRTLRRDFELITMTRWKKESPVAYDSAGLIYYAYPYTGSPTKNEVDYVVADKNCSALDHLETGAKKKKTEVRIFGQPQKAPDSIQVKHFNFNMTISLKKLERIR